MMKGPRERALPLLGSSGFEYLKPGMPESPVMEGRR
jgi:hypothetical protein